MLPLILLTLALLTSFILLFVKKDWNRTAEVVLSCLIFFNIGLMGLLAAYSHLFMPAQIAKHIGWPAGSPFQFEIGITNLAFGVLGVLSAFYRGSFWLATVLGASILMLGCFVGHLIQYSHGDTAPYNIGLFIWINNLALPLIYLGLLFYLKKTGRISFKS